jgi:hypothetical protein
MSTVPANIVPLAPAQRHALGLPAGSVRALLALMVVGLVCLVVVVPTHEPVPISPYLIYLLFMILGHFFASHGHTIGVGQASPLYLPAGFVRLAIILALAAAFGWKLYADPDGLEAQFVRSVEELKRQPYLPLLLLGGFFIGVIVRMIVGRTRPPMWFQDLEAWLSLLAIVGLSVAAIIHVVINPSMEHPISLPNWEGFLAVVVAFYFGERS